MYPDEKFDANYATDDAVYFFTSAFDPLNPWSAHAVEVWGIRFPTIEHAYHYKKFAGHAQAVADEILHAPSPWAAMKKEREYGANRRVDWEEIKVGVMTEIMRAATEQNEDIRQCLLVTGTRTIVKNSPVDEFWGNGANGKGANMTGKILMQLREEIRASETD